MKKKVLVAMSGGVDSSVAAKLLLDQGYEVVGATMQIWQDDQTQDQCDRGCCSLSAVEDARHVAQKLGIPYYVLNMKQSFREQVIVPFVEAYWEAKTPNPCILCNRYVKFEDFLQKALLMGFDYIATGHYGRVCYNEETGRYALGLSATAAKDQTYALYSLSQEQLAHLLLPLGDLEKEAVRKIALEANLAVAHKRDSQEICFVSDGDYAHFVETFSGRRSQEGNFVLESGEVIGRHRGLIHYTIGQRKGLGIAYKHPLFVKELRPKTNEVVLSTNASLFSSALLAEDPVWSAWENLPGKTRVMAKIRYRASAEPAWLLPYGENQIALLFDEPQRAITPGQAVVCYREGLVLGGATILQSLAAEEVEERMKE